jgi:hypothetical protein
MRDAPPFELGLEKFTESCALPGVIEVIVGAVGTVASASKVPVFVSEIAVEVPPAPPYSIK